MSRNRNRRAAKDQRARVRTAFDARALKTACELEETAFPRAYELEVTRVAQDGPEDWYAFRDAGSRVLAVAHLDTVASPHARSCTFVDTAAGQVVYSRALDDRLGAYVVLDLLPALGVECDALLTVGEESCQSTAAFFTPDKDYDWIIEFDRGGTDVVLYQYEDADTVELVEACGADVGQGSFSDIAELEHLGVKAFNWGVGYRDYHTARSHAYLEDTFTMVGQFLDFHAANAGVHLPHEAWHRRAVHYSWDDDTPAVLDAAWNAL